MADVITNQDLDDDKKKSSGVQTNQGASSSEQNDGNAQIAQNYSGGNPSQGAPQGAGAPTPPAAPTAPNQHKGSGYTNIQRIVGANQSNKLGQTIGQNIQNAGQQAQQNVTNAQQQFQQQAGANRADTGQNAQLVQQALNDPTKVSDPNQINKFQNLLGGVYQGPQGLQNAGQLKAQAQDVSQLGQAIGSAGGRQGLLQRFVGNPQYTSGQQTMDSLLLGATGAQDLAQARRATTGIEKQQQQAEQGASQTAKEYADRAQQFGKDVQNQFGQKVSGEQAGLVQQAQDAQQARDAKVAALQQQVEQGNITQEMADQLGLQAQNVANVTMGPGAFGTQGAGVDMSQQGLYTYGVDPSKFISKNAQQATAQNAANSQQYAQMQALAKLGGQFAPQQAQQTLAQFNNPSQAGSFQAAKAYNVDNPGFQQALQGGQESYKNYLDTVLNPAVSTYNQGQQNANMQRAFASSTGTSYGGDPGPRWDLYWKLLNPYSQQLNQAKAGALQSLGKQYNIVPGEEQS